jgi:hypothetical protein
VYAWLVGLSASSAGASPIHAFRVATPDVLGPAWAQFLAGGPTLWADATPPSLPTGLILPYQNGALVETPFVDYLVWRRSLDPARFDQNHPKIAPALGQLIPPTTAVPGSTTIGTPPINPQPQNGVPEPASLPLALSLIAAGLWWRRHIGRTV